MTIQQLIQMLQQHDGNLAIQFFINKVPVANAEACIDYQLENFVAFNLMTTNK